MAGKGADEEGTSGVGITSQLQKVSMVAGGSVSVQRAGSDARVSATILGSVPGSYIALRSPHGSSMSEGLRSLNLLITDDVILRFLYDGVIYAFKTSVWRVATVPEYLLFLHYPTTVEKASLRQVARTSCRLPCQVSFGSTMVAALMLDISAAGCAVTSALKNDDDLPTEGDSVTVSVALPARTDPLQATGHIQRIGSESHKRTWEAGIAFSEPTNLVTVLAPYLRLAPIDY